MNLVTSTSTDKISCFYMEIYKQKKNTETVNKETEICRQGLKTCGRN